MFLAGTDENVLGMSWSLDSSFSITGSAAVLPSSLPKMTDIAQESWQPPSDIAIWHLSDI